jgi:hypothetical protein
MPPAFSSTRQKAVFGLTLLFFLMLPVLLLAIGRNSREELYRGISERAGAFDFIRRQIFEDRSDVDIAFCGTSLLAGAINPEMVGQELSRALGRPSRVVLLPQSWQGPDMNYVVARDLLEHRKVKVLVIAAPAWVHRQNQPHVQLFRVIGYGDQPHALDGLGLRYRLAIYGDYVLGAPRRALDLLRPNLVDPHAGFIHEYGTAAGYRGAPFVRHESTAAPVPPRQMIASGETTDIFHFDGPPLNNYQLHFIRKTVELTRHHDTTLVILHMPSPSERGSRIVPDRQLMPSVFADGVVFSGIASASMFQNVPPGDFFDYFHDEHLNTNGMELFTKTITPALIQIYDRYQQGRN